MRVGMRSEHWDDASGNPDGGSTFGNGFAISWQRGPLGRHAPECISASEGNTGAGTMSCAPGCTRRPPNGAFVEDVIAAAADRIEFYQGSKFACARNEKALEHLRAALSELEARTKERESRQVEGTHFR